jgi:hypothetical protein
MNGDAMKFRRRILKRRFVEGDSGGVLGGHFSVQFVGLYKLRYQEGDHSAVAEVEPLKGEVNWMIYLDSILGWAPPFEDAVLARQQVDQIRANVILALDAMGVRYVASGIPGPASTPS